MIQEMWMSFAQCEHSIHASLGGCEIAQFLGRHTGQTALHVCGEWKKHALH